MAQNISKRVKNEMVSEVMLKAATSKTIKMRPAILIPYPFALPVSWWYPLISFLRSCFISRPYDYLSIERDALRRHVR